MLLTVSFSLNVLNNLPTSFFFIFFSSWLIDNEIKCKLYFAVFLVVWDISKENKYTYTYFYTYAGNTIHTSCNVYTVYVTYEKLSI